ncbi:MAG: hypothetical protein ACI4PG_05705 [Candidatus Ventricola sp.]
MNKPRMRTLLALLMLLLCRAAAAQTLPGIECFSPGLMRWSTLEGQGAPVRAQAEFTVQQAMYARDLSVLSAMLSGTTFGYEGVPGAERLSVERDGETLLTAALVRDGDGARLALNGQVFDAGALVDPRLDALEDALAGVAPLERVPLTSVADWLESLAPGDTLAFGFAVTQAFALERTMSDDGTRLTRIDVRGAIAREGGADYVVTGFLRQPAGRSPKDTFELVLTRDEQNFIELSYSALRENTIATKNKKGTTSVRTTLKAAGKLEGSRITTRLTVTTRNDWTADGESLSEKLTLSATLSHQDGRPGMRMLRLNSVEGEARSVLRLTTAEQGTDTVSLTDESTLKLTMDGNTVLDGGMTMRLAVGGEAPAIGASGEIQDAQALPDAVGQAAQALAAAVYPHLGDAVRVKIHNGL